MNLEHPYILLVEDDPSHANSFLVKPVVNARFAAIMETLGDYWLTWNECPR